MKPVWSILSLALSLACLPLSSAQESVTQEDLESFEQQLEADRIALEAIEAAQNAAQADLSVVNRQLLAAAQDSMRHEEQATIIERRLIDLQIRERTARDQLMADREGLRDLLAALTTASRRQPPALATHPDNATEAIRAAIIMRDLADTLKDRSAELRVQIREYSELKESVGREKERLDAEELILSENEQQIIQLAAVKRAAFEDMTGEADTLRRRVDALAARAENVRTLLASLAEAAPTAPGRKPPAPSSGPTRVQPTPPRTSAPVNVAVLERLGLPATGQLVRAFGDALPTGRTSEGITLRTRTSAQVVAPSDAVIEYAGEFRSYGQMLILRTGDGYHIVLYGLSDLYATLGQSVLAGEPVGRMSSEPGAVPDLHMELRKDGTPEDPAQWMSRSAG